jgi:hypothetical protein
MPGAKNQLKTNIKALLQEMKGYDGTTGKTQEDAMENFATKLSNHIDTYIGSIKVIANPNQVAAAGLANGGGAVTATANLESSFQ